LTESRPTVVTEKDELAALATRASRAARVAIDVEANGRFAYKARICVLQVAYDDSVVLVDPLAPAIGGDLSHLAHLLSKDGPVKIVHDVGFDARLLAESGIVLGNVHDTALTASWLGRASTGLAALALSELGVALDKSAQAQNWGLRPLDDRSSEYLAGDVLHLVDLERLLFREAEAAGIVDELAEETAYRLSSALRAVREPDPRPAFTRIKGASELEPPERSILRRLVMAREAEARSLDTPAAELVPNGLLIPLARRRPRTRQELARIRAPIARFDADRVGDALLAAIADGLADGALSPEDSAWFDPPSLGADAIKATREREKRLSKWRKAEATARGVHEQVVLPGHCASDIVRLAPSTLAELAQVEGIGAFRVARYGPSLLAALSEPSVA
jgi:ribonuclease D